MDARGLPKFEYLRFRTLTSPGDAVLLLHDASGKPLTWDSASTVDPLVNIAQARRKDLVRDAVKAARPGLGRLVVLMPGVETRLLPTIARPAMRDLLQAHPAPWGLAFYLAPDGPTRPLVALSGLVVPPITELEIRETLGVGEIGR